MNEDINYKCVSQNKRRHIQMQGKIDDLEKHLEIEISIRNDCLDGQRCKIVRLEKKVEILLECATIYNGEGFDHSFKAVAQVAINKVQELDK